MSSSADDAALVSAAFKGHRSTIICPGCQTAGKITFSSDGNGRLRFCCSNKQKSCRKSFSIKNMALLINSFHPGTVRLSGDTTTGITNPSNGNLEVVNGSNTSLLNDTDISVSSTTGQTFNFGITSFPTSLKTSSAIRRKSNNLIEEFMAQRNKRSNPESPPEAPNPVRPRLIGTPTNSNINNIGESDDDDLTEDRDTIINKQASEISLLREEVKDLTSQVTTLVSFFNQLKNSGIFNPTNLQTSSILLNNISNTSSTEETASAETQNILPNNNSGAHPINSPTEKNIQSTSSNAITGNNKKSYAEIAASRGLQGEQQEAAIKALQSLCKRPRIKPNFQNLQRVYVQGIARQPIKQLKNILQTVRIRTSAIPSISFVGLQTVEFLVTVDYVKNFKKSIIQLSPVNNRFRILETFDASKPSDLSASADLKSKLQLAFVHRVHGIINKNTNQTARNHYLNWLKALDLPIPEPINKPIEPGFENKSVEMEEEDMEEEVISDSEVSTPPISPVESSQQAPQLHS